MFRIFFHTKYREVLQILGLCLLWYILSSAMGIIGKILLSDFPYPMTVTMVQLLSITIYLIPVLKNFVVSHTTWIPYNISLRYWILMILPLAFGKFISSVSSHVSIWKVPVSYAHTVKATMPFFTVVLSRIILKERQTKKVYFSLVPIICGVIIASLTELSFDVVGLISALISTIGFALQNIFSKKCLRETNLHQFSLLFTLAIISGILFFPLWVFYDLTRILHDSNLSQSSHLPRLVALLIIDGFCNFAQNLVAFSIIALVAPLTYAVASCTKRIAVISVSLLVLRNPVTNINIVGMIMAIFGVLLYNKAKYEQHQEKKLITTLPTVVQSESPALPRNQLFEFADYDHLQNGFVLGERNPNLFESMQLDVASFDEMDNGLRNLNPFQNKQRKSSFVRTNNLMKTQN